MIGRDEDDDKSHDTTSNPRIIDKADGWMDAPSSEGLQDGTCSNNSAKESRCCATQRSHATAAAVAFCCWWM